MKGRKFAGLAACAAAIALAVASPQVGGQQKAPAARAAASGPKATAAKPPSESYAQRFAGLCAACHGGNGRSDMALTPVLAGQPSLYAITQLFLFREGRRNNEAMTAVAKTMTDADMRGFSDYIGTLPPVPAPALPTDPARMVRGQALAEQHKCLFCHGPALAGGQQVPRIAGQREDYLRESLHGFHSGKRPGYTQAMTAAVSGIPVEDLDTLAYFAARFTPAAGAPATK